MQSESDRLSIDVYAMFTAIEMLANLAANCEFKVFINGREEKNKLWALLNYQPNVNQTATEFWREFYKKMLYDGEVMAFETLDEQMIIADGFSISDYVIKEKYFSNVWRGTFSSFQTFRMSDVVYINYPNEGIITLKNGLLSRYDELITAATESYKSGSGEKVFLNIPAAASGMPNFEDRFKDIMENRFKSFFKQKNAVLPLFNGMQATFAGSSESNKSTIEDIKKIMNESLTRSAQALKMSPALLTGEIAGIKDALHFTLTAAIDPLMNAVSEQLSVKYFGTSEIIKGSYVVGDTSNINHVDVFDLAGAVDKLISSGFYSPEETRIAAGIQPTGIEAMQKHYITKNYIPIDQLEAVGGDAE